MKKIFYIVSALIAIASVASCQKSIEVDEGVNELVDVTFIVNTESALATKSIGYADTYEKQLTVLVYKDNVLLDQLVPDIDDFDGVGDLDATVTVRLVKGQEYDIVFWAQAEGQDYYSIDSAYPATVTVDYKNLKANDEKRDAFYYVLNHTVEAGAAPRSVNLVRPFAQINVGTTEADVAAAKVAGVVINKSYVTFSKVANKLNLFTGEATGEETVTFESELIPDQKLTVYGDSDKTTSREYHYLSMNYLLVKDNGTGEKYTLDTYKVTFCQNDLVINTVSVPTVPVRRNWRTNIIGENILTDNARFTVTIDPDFYGEYDGPDQNGDFDEILYN